MPFARPRHMHPRLLGLESNGSEWMFGWVNAPGKSHIESVPGRKYGSMECPLGIQKAGGRFDTWDPRQPGKKKEYKTVGAGLATERI